MNVTSGALPRGFCPTRCVPLRLPKSRWRPRRVVDLVTEPHGHFTPMLRTSHTVLELMPDTPEVEAEAAPANEAEMVDEHPAAQDEPMPPRTGTL